MSKLTIEIEIDEEKEFSAPVIRVFANDHLLSMLQSIEFSATANDTYPKLSISLPDINEFANSDAADTDNAKNIINKIKKHKDILKPFEFLNLISIPNKTKVNTKSYSFSSDEEREYQDMLLSKE